MIPQSGPETSASPLAGILDPDSLGNPHLTLGVGDRRMTSPTYRELCSLPASGAGDCLCLELSVEHGEAQGDHVSGVGEKLWRMGTH